MCWFAFRFHWTDRQVQPTSGSLPLSLSLASGHNEYLQPDTRGCYYNQIPVGAMLFYNRIPVGALLVLLPEQQN